MRSTSCVRQRTSSHVSNLVSDGHVDRRVQNRKSASMVSRAIQSSLRSIATKAIDICPSSGLDAWHERDDARTAGAIRMREPQLSRLVHPDCQRSRLLLRCRHWSRCLIRPRILCTSVHAESGWTNSPQPKKRQELASASPCEITTCESALAPPVGLEPTTRRLTAACSTN